MRVAISMNNFSLKNKVNTKNTENSKSNKKILNHTKLLHIIDQQGFQIKNTAG